MEAARPGKAGWRKSSFSSTNGECVEVARADRRVLLRDSTDKQGPVLVFGLDEWRAFMAEMRSGLLEESP